MNSLDYCEFYITNVCNYNCTNCNRFNNFAFNGHQRWSEYADVYKHWANFINFKEIGILGGEPMLNPDFIQWVEGIADLFPEARVKIITNGSQLNRWPQLYETLKKYKGRIIISASLHTVNRKKFESLVENFLQKPYDKKILINYSARNQLWIDCYNRVKDPSWPECTSLGDFYCLPEHIQQECRTQHHISPDIWKEEVCDGHYVDKNQIEIRYSLSNSFNNATIIHDQITDQLQVNRSDPDEAWNICYFKKCHTFMNGKLYKCGVVAVLPEFIKQFKVELSESEKELINSYKAASINQPLEEINNFINSLKPENATSIDQCKFCPSKFTPVKFEAGTKKLKITKLVK